MWLLGYIFGALTLVIDLVLIILSIVLTESTMWGGVILFTILTIILFVSSSKASKMKKVQKEYKLAQNRPLMEDTDLMLIEQGHLPVVTETPAILKEGETAHYYAPATRSVTKTKVIGHTGGGAGVSVRVAKGVTLRTGSGASQSIRGNVTDKYTGAVVLTNQRLIFLHSQAGFECKLTSITAITPMSNSIMIQVSSKSYQLLVARNDLFETVLRSVMK